MVTNGVNGYTVELKDCEVLADCLVKLFAGPDLAANCRSYAENNLRLDVQASRYQALYDDLLKDPAFGPLGKLAKFPMYFQNLHLLG